MAAFFRLMSLADSASAEGSDQLMASAAEDRERLEAMARAEFQFIWRSLRRLGVPQPAVDDAAQKVFEIATRKLGAIRRGSERAYLFNTAVRVAAGIRRRDVTRRETSDFVLEDHVDSSPRPDEAVEWKRQRECLDSILDSMPTELRVVFVVFELEGLTTKAIAELLGIPHGTAASRLRRARELFQAEVKRLTAKRTFSGGRT
jgi:RNA polymerase sigma-70 factor (ECF subfamily)